MPSATDIELLEYGVVPYGQALALQHELRDRLIDGQVSGDCAGWLICLEHEPVVTLGKRGEENHLVDRESLRNQGVEVFPIDRGGEATYHGPGQLVIYPVVEIDRLDIAGVVDLVHGLADCIADAFEEFDVEAGYDSDHPGVWTKDETPSRKLASVGMRVRRGVTTHGAAINLVNDMRPFSMIVPCGMPQAPMARLEDYIDGRSDELQPRSFRNRLYDGLEDITGTSLVEGDVDLPSESDWVEPVDY
jgi:lipoate-protein ligase B